MARTPATAPPASRRAAPPPPVVEEQPDDDLTVYDEVWNTVVAADPRFPEQTTAEADTDFFSRLSQGLAAATEDPEVWNGLTPEAQQWYDATVTAIETPGAELPAPDGFYADEEGAEAEPEAEISEEAEAPPPEPEVKKTHAGRDALAAYRAKKAAEKTAAQAAPAPAARRGRGAAVQAPPTPVRAPAAAAPRRGVVAAPPPPAAAPARRGATPVATAPARRGQAATRPAATTAPRAAPMQREKSGVEYIRELIVLNPDITKDEIIEWMVENVQQQPRETTVISLMTATKTCMNTIKRLGHWAD